jgi:glutaminyl-tRNA synthetase
VMVVLDPVKLIITDYPEDKTEIFHGENIPEKEDKGGK